jgi:two-component system phosphate regulon sensor histidine kinase PhoR
MLVKKIFKIEKDNKFVGRVLMLSLPAAAVLFMLVVLKILPATFAIISYGTIVFFNFVFLFPITSEMQILKDYIASLASGGDATSEMHVSEKEAQEIVQAVNAMHRFWTAKAGELQAKCISDTAVLDTLPDPIMMIDRAGNILGANLSARTLLGKSILDKNIEKVFDSLNFIEAVDRVLEKKSEAENLIFYIKKPDMQKFYAHIKELPWISRGRAVAVVSIYDMTKSMKIEQMQSDFVANASHELRTPLSVISGFIETLQTSAKNDKVARDKFLKIMAEQTEYMSHLIENLLSLSKIEMSQDQRPDEKVKIPKIIDEVAKALELKASAREISFAIDIEPKLPDIIADRGQVKQLIQNLCDNAVKYGTAGSDVMISVKLTDKIPGSKSVKVSKGAAVAIAINNKGPKISAESLARVTERFYRLQEHKNLNIKGTGLGLTIAKTIVMRHRGNLTVTSTAYGGTTFTIYLPLRQ